MRLLVRSLSIADDESKSLLDWLATIDRRHTRKEAAARPVVGADAASIVGTGIHATAHMTPEARQAFATLYVPPLEPRPRDPEVMKRLGLGSD